MKTQSSLIAILALVSCGPAPKTNPETEALLGVKAFVNTNLNDLVDATTKLQAAAPAPDADGWNATADAAAVNEMKAQWKRARTAYEHIEGAIAVLFPDLDVSTDERYDGFISENGEDTNLFDDQNVTGVHAIERILWSDSIPQSVVTFESGVAGYKAAAFPSNQQEATDFKTKLAARLVTDVKTMRDQFAPLALDPAAAYRGIIGSMAEQLEKAEKAATGEEESRYAQYTLADMRVNVEAGIKTFDIFKPWLESKGATDKITKIADGFARVKAAYAQLSGDALPAVPATWSSQTPSNEDLQTPFGKLWTVLHHEADDTVAGTLVSEMNSSADALGIAQLAE